MEFVIVTVKRQNEAQVHDIELAIDRPLHELCAMIAAGLGWDTDDQGRPVDHSVETHPPGRFLKPEETLAQAQVWDGTWLVLHPRPAADAPSPPEPPDPPPSAPDEPDPGPGFVWKQVA